MKSNSRRDMIDFPDEPEQPLFNKRIVYNKRKHINKSFMESKLAPINYYKMADPISSVLFALI